MDGLDSACLERVLTYATDAGCDVAAVCRAWRAIARRSKWWWRRVVCGRAFAASPWTQQGGQVDDRGARWLASLVLLRQVREEARFSDFLTTTISAWLQPSTSTLIYIHTWKRYLAFMNSTAAAVDDGQGSHTRPAIGASCDPEPVIIAVRCVGEARHQWDVLIWALHPSGYLTELEFHDCGRLPLNPPRLVIRTSEAEEFSCTYDDDWSPASGIRDVALLALTGDFGRVAFPDSGQGWRPTRDYRGRWGHGNDVLWCRLEPPQCLGAALYAADRRGYRERANAWADELRCRTDDSRAVAHNLQLLLFMHVCCPADLADAILEASRGACPMEWMFDDDSSRRNI